MRPRRSEVDFLSAIGFHSRQELPQLLPSLSVAATGSRFHPVFFVYIPFVRLPLPHGRLLRLDTLPTVRQLHAKPTSPHFCPALSERRLRHALASDPRRLPQHHRQRASAIPRMPLPSRPTPRHHPTWRPITAPDATADFLWGAVQAKAEAQACRSAAGSEYNG